MAARRWDESSLELLLDTMCNAFGGVMFIAIALVVVISFIPRISSGNGPEQSAEPLLNEIRVLEKELENRKLALNLEEKLAGQMIGDPRLKMLPDIVRLENEAASAEAKLESARSRRNAAAEQLAAARKVLEKVQKEESGLKSGLETARKDSESAEEQLRALSKILQSIRPMKGIVFKQLRNTGDAPFFVILTRGRVWRIGPVRLPSPETFPDVSVDRQGNSFLCTPATAGIPVLSPGGELTGGVCRFLDSLPDGRYPHFQITADSAREMYVIREYLKKKNILQVFSPCGSSDKFGFCLASNPKREVN